MNRRNFLKGLGGGALAGLVAGKAKATALPVPVAKADDCNGTQVLPGSPGRQTVVARVDNCIGMRMSDTCGGGIVLYYDKPVGVALTDPDAEGYQQVLVSGQVQVPVAKRDLNKRGFWMPGPTAPLRGRSVEYTEEDSD